MSFPSDNERIKVYSTVNELIPDDIYELLRSAAFETFEEAREQFAIKFMPDERPLRIFQYQNEKYKIPDQSEESYFLIVDSANPGKDGVLLCNLKADHGLPDALRVMPDMAGMTAASLGIANSDWTDVREATFRERKPPVCRIAVYDNRQHADRGSFHPLADAVDVGLHYVNDEGEPRAQGSIDDLFRYVAISPDNAGSLDDDELVKQHQRYAQEKDLDPERFAVVDDVFMEEGVSLRLVQPRSELRCSPPLAGELLYWHAIGFMDWEEVKKFASKHGDFVG